MHVSSDTYKKIKLLPYIVLQFLSYSVLRLYWYFTASKTTIHSFLMLYIIDRLQAAPLNMPRFNFLYGLIEQCKQWVEHINQFYLMALLLSWHILNIESKPLVLHSVDFATKTFSFLQKAMQNKIIANTSQNRLFFDRICIAKCKTSSKHN